MSTRANVIVENEHLSIYLYQHCDGYPKYLGGIIAEFLRSEEAQEYKGELMNLAGALMLYSAKKAPRPGYMPSILVPTSGIHGDIQYLYTINSETLEMTTEGEDHD